MRLVRLGYSCNNACLFCAQGDLRARSSSLREAELKAALAEVEDEVVAFVGGEPTLFDSLSQAARWAREGGARSVLVQTNGRRLAYKSYARALAEAGVDALDVSLHGSTAAIHDYHTTVSGSFAQTLTGMAHARDAGIAIGTTTVVTRSNFRHLSEIVRVGYAQGARAVHFASTIPEGRARLFRARLIPPRELAAPHLMTALSVAKRLGLEFLADRLESSERVRERFAGLGETDEDVAPPT